MQDKLVFEYAVIRVVPRVEREEFINAGVIVFCKSKGFLRCRYQLNEHKLLALCPLLDYSDVENNLKSFEAICKGSSDAGAIASLDVPSRFRWLTAVRSTVVQTSRVHPGLCYDLDENLHNLFFQLVL